jgi:hypothetical protein
MISGNKYSVVVMMDINLLGHKESKWQILRHGLAQKI